MRIPVSFVALLGAVAISIAPIVQASEPPEPENDWLTVVRDSPYWTSKGVYDNIITIRRWVLKELGFCSRPDRHILFDRRGKFLSFIEDGASREATQIRLNETRALMAARGDVDDWTPGSLSKTGYPFALSCLQPHVDLSAAVDRYLGATEADRLWGTWDDLSFASAEEPRSLHEAMQYVYETRLNQQRLDLPDILPRYLGGQVLIESSGQPRAHSTANAKGILQLSPSALGDCQVSPDNHWHRLAQVDCALKLMQQNARNLEPAFMKRFGNLPAEKRDRLFSLLLVQAYHGGLGRVVSLLEDEDLSKPAAFFAREYDNFSAGDILFGMIFHNLGRNRFGLASLYYVADVQLATETICANDRLSGDSFCN